MWGESLVSAPSRRASVTSRSQECQSVRQCSLLRFAHVCFRHLCITRIIPQRALSQLLPNIHVHHPARRKAPRNPQPSPSAQKKRGEKPIVKRWISQFNYLYVYGTRRGARARSHGWLSILDLNCWSVFSSEVQVVLCAPQRRSRFVQRSSCRGSTTTRTRCPACDGLISLAKHVF